MSVLSAPSPLLAKRRHFDDENAENAPCDRHHLFSGGKRARQQYSPPAGRCHLAAVGGLHGCTVPPTTLAALRALFPGMSEEVCYTPINCMGQMISQRSTSKDKFACWICLSGAPQTVSTVLQECGNNIDAAIRRLGELRLTVEDGSPPAEQTQQGPATPQANAATGAFLISTKGHTAVTAALYALHGRSSSCCSHPHSCSHGAECVCILAPAAGPDVQTANAGGLEQPAPGPTTAEQWVELLVAEMSAATDLPNAKQRAAGFLRQFEDFVARFVKQQQVGNPCVEGCGNSTCLCLLPCGSCRTRPMRTACTYTIEHLPGTTRLSTV